MPFYTYNQNNSGGTFIINDDVAHYVIIEADNARAANDKAEDVGIYFEGCDSGTDCPCCGDRWYSPWADDGEEAPMIYGNAPEDFDDIWARHGKAYCHVYYADGTKVSHVNKEQTA